MFYIEKYQEFAYFDMFLVFVQKNGKIQILGKIDAKRKAGTRFLREQRIQGLKCPFLQHRARRDQTAPCGGTDLHLIPLCQRAGVSLQTFKSFGAEARFLKTWNSCNPKTRAAGPVFHRSGFLKINPVPGQITPRAKHENCSYGSKEQNPGGIVRIDPVSREKGREEGARALFFRQKRGLDSSPNISDSGTN